jgi:hypothetical protein
MNGNKEKPHTKLMTRGKLFTMKKIHCKDSKFTITKAEIYN